MYLKGLYIQGFKSFADKTKMEFNDGITAVVGPNGSGKSNVSDAVRWVLGEQSVKSLRGSKMEDVIFSGTQQRKPLGFAEVSMIMDNSDHMLPLEFDEVKITRKVYRSGESEYRINNTLCRLKDIHELFFDTGIGKDGYSIIGQGKIDEILSSKSEDRRGVFEDASGIMKYKTRKIEAERKLEHTKNNLVRITDIIYELENQIGPLESQSKKAKLYLDYSNTLKDKDISLMIHNLDEIEKGINGVEELFNHKNEELELLTQEINDLENKVEIDEANYKSMQYQHETMTSEIHNAENNRITLESQIKINQEKIKNLNENKDRLLGEIDKIKENSKNVNINYRKNTDDVIELEREINNKEKQKRALDDELTQNALELDKINKQLNENNQTLNDSKLEIVNKKNQIENIKSSSVSLNERLDKLSDEKNKLESELQSATNFKLQTQAEHDKLSLEMADFNEIIAKKESEVATINSLLQKSVQKQKETQDSLTYKNSRLRIIKDLENSYEGYSKSVKSILTLNQAGIHGTVAQLIDIPREYEVAIDIALGAGAQNIVAESDQIAKKSIDYLVQNKLGRATFLPLNTVKAQFFDDSTKNKLKKCSGFIGIASELIEYDSKFANACSRLLGKTVLFDSFQSAANASKLFNQTLRIVTLKGELFNPGGSITGGTSNKSSGGIITRKNEIEGLTADIAELNKELLKYNRDVEELSSQNDEILKERSEINTQINSLLVSKAKYDEALKNIDFSIDDLKNRISSYDNDCDLIKNTIKEGVSILDDLQKEIDELNAQQENLSEDVLSFDKSLQSIYEQKSEINNKLQTIFVEINSLLEKKRLLTEQRSQFKDSLSSFDEEISQRNEQIQTIDSNLILIDLEVKECEDEIAKNTNLTLNGKEELTQLNAKKEKLDSLIQNNKQLLTDNRIKHSSLKDEVTNLDLKVSKNRVRIDNIKNTLWEKYELTYSTAKNIAFEIDNINLIQDEINDLNRKIRNLGTINLAAIEDYEKTKERYEFMKTQSQDLIESRDKLYKIIDEIQAKMKKQFLEQFKYISKSFSKVFKELFNGGKAEIVLTDTSNVLESGIDIHVQPPGKKLQNMMLLSGGEKALTAIALLFAILTTRPTPFCILDEIEAALDESNVQRFGAYLKDFSKDTQFLVITHRKGTMESANSLYGITMQEHGISKLVSLELNSKMNGVK